MGRSGEEGAVTLNVWDIMEHPRDWYLVQMKLSQLESVLTINPPNKTWQRRLGWGLEEWGQ